MNGNTDKTLISAIDGLAYRLGLPLILVLIIGLNVYWSLTLTAFGNTFEGVVGLPLLDLENVGSIMSAPDATALIQAYPAEGKTLYWAFFILDNLMPPLVFGSFALLWAVMLRRFPKRWSVLVLLPFGVGFFDCLENLCFVLAMSADASTGLQIMQVGLTFVTLKAACLFAVFGLTPVFALIALVSQFRTSRRLVASNA